MHETTSSAAGERVPSLPPVLRIRLYEAVLAATPAIVLASCCGAALVILALRAPIPLALSLAPGALLIRRAILRQVAEAARLTRMPAGTASRGGPPGA